MDFGELCSDFECISSPYVESTARQVARDILELREDNRAFNCYAVSVKYKVLLVAAHLISPSATRIMPPLLLPVSQFSDALYAYLSLCLCIPCSRTHSGHLLGVRSTGGRCGSPRRWKTL
jgi:hypothetical protein